jgi:NAD(P)-dependent dehydrogenase (short-subunit alcohol dehydrogenase family)
MKMPLPVPDPLFSLQDKRVIITGAGGSIGSLVAEAMADRGAVVGLQDISAEKVDVVRDRIESTGGRAITLVSDLSTAEGAHTMVTDAAERLGGLDVLINGAGINRRKPIVDVTSDDFDAIVAVNMRAVYFACQAAHPLMKDAGGGAIVNLSSLSARFSFNTISVYAATKAAVSSMTRSCAREWAVDGIRVNCIEPSVIKTEFTKPLWGEAHRQRWFDETTPIGRLALPEEMIGSIIFLSTQASSYITGQSIVIDGGILSGADWDSYKDD